MNQDNKQKKPSELFEGENSSLKRAYDSTLQKEEGWEWPLWVEVMEDYVITAELGHVAKDEKQHKDEMRQHFDKLKSFIRSLLASERQKAKEEAEFDLQKLAEETVRLDERAKVREEINDELKGILVKIRGNVIFGLKDIGIADPDKVEDALIPLVDMICKLNELTPN